MSLKSQALSIAILVIASISSVIWWNQSQEPTRTTGEIQKVEPSKRLEPIHPPVVMVQPPAAKKKLKLPAEISKDPAKHVVESVKLKSDTHPQEVIVMMDESTGQVDTYTRRSPLPLIQAEKTGELRLDYGLKDGPNRVARLSINQNLVAIKALHLGASASLDSEGGWFVGGSIAYRW